MSPDLVPLKTGTAYALLLAGLAGLSACDAGGGDGGGHSHQRGHMLITHASDGHVLLTAHLAAAGNELDIFFEDGDDDPPRPLAIGAEPFMAQARAGEGEWRELKFECAPSDERPGDEPPGKCSHFVAKAPWIEAADTLHVKAKVKIAGAEETAEWKSFAVAKYAHHVEGR